MVMQLYCGQLGNGKITHAEFTTAGRSNGRVGPVARTRIPVGSAFHATEKIPLPHLLLTCGCQKFQPPISFLRRTHYGYNRWWKHNTVASIATVAKVAIVISQSVVVILHVQSSDPTQIIKQVDKYRKNYFWSGETSTERAHVWLPRNQHVDQRMRVAQELQI